MDHLPLFLPAFAILFVGTLSPGPAVAFLLGLGMAQGRRAALIATLGIASGSACLNVLTMLGVGVLIQQTAWALSAVKLAGAAYLAWLALRSFRTAFSPPAALNPAQAPALGATRLFVMGALMQLTNPKAIMFWLAIAALGATAGAGPWLTVAFVAICFAISFAGHGGWALLLSGGALRRRYVRVRRWIDGTLGLVFAAFALRLATDRS